MLMCRSPFQGLLFIYTSQSQPPRCHPDSIAECVLGEGCVCVCVCLWYGYNQGCCGSALAVCAPDMTPGQTLLVSNPRTDFQLVEKPIIDLCCLFQRHFNRGRPTVHAHICRKLLLLEAFLFLFSSACIRRRQTF